MSNWLGISLIGILLLVVGMSGGYYLSIKLPPSVTDDANKHTIQCLKGSFSVQTSFTPGFSGGMNIGEQLLCGENLKISAIYGPDLDTWMERGVGFYIFQGGFDPLANENVEKSNPIP